MREDVLPPPRLHGMRFNLSTETNLCAFSMEVEWVVLIEPEFLIPVAVRYKAWVYGRSFVGMSGSNPAANLDAFLLWLLCVVR